MNGHIAGFCPGSKVRTTLKDSIIHSGSERVKEPLKDPSKILKDALTILKDLEGS